ncbi:MAG: type II toxin-antitoxin system RelE/ParE family toxin [Desulfobacteraceae bacterium]|nr:type II toxin-antitoxin system RelE/ParE family toxin [Desulfobacteraceae bacterium]
MKAIIWKNRARKQLKRIPKNYRVKILEGVFSLKRFPECHDLDIKPLVNHQYGFRLRIARYRVFFDNRDTLKIIEI